MGFWLALMCLIVVKAGQWEGEGEEEEEEEEEEKEDEEVWPCHMSGS
jgi:hypothetical protein